MHDTSLSAGCCYVTGPGVIIVLEKSINDMQHNNVILIFSFSLLRGCCCV